MIRKSHFLSALLGGILLSSVCAKASEDLPFAAASSWARESHFDLATAERLTAQIGRLHDVPSEQLKADIATYRSHYQLGTKAFHHQMAAVWVGGKKIVYQIFENRNFQAPVVFLVHGYLDHLGVLRYLVEELIDMGFNVVAMDLAGHGLSGGKRAYIEDFSDYAHAIDSILNELRFSGSFSTEQLQSMKAVAHSTGSSALMLYQSLFGEKFERMVFLAPLVRSYAHGFIKFSFSALSIFTRTLPRRTRGSSSNPEYYRFIENYDPLVIDSVPLAWGHAYIDWENRTDQLKSFGTPVLIAQGQRDSVVANRYNRRFIEELYPNFEYLSLPKARHNLATEPREITQRMYQRMAKFLKADAN